MSDVQKITRIIFFAFVLMLSACGFHMRNQNALPQGLHILYVQSAEPYGSFSSLVRHTLRSSGVVVVDSPKQAPITLQLSAPIIGNNSATIGPSSQTRVYSITYSVSFTLLNSQGKELIKPQILSSSRSLTLSANQMIESNNQVKVLTKEMERDIVNQLYNHLLSQQVAQAISP